MTRGWAGVRFWLLVGSPPGREQKWSRFIKNVILGSGFWEARPTPDLLGQEAGAARLRLNFRFDPQITGCFVDFDGFEVLEFVIRSTNCKIFYGF